MQVVGRFICRREGHRPSVTVRNGYGWVSYITTCLRCGKAFEVKNPNQQAL